MSHHHILIYTYESREQASGRVSRTERVSGASGYAWTVFETDRTDILISALRDYLRDAAHDDEIKQEIAGAYYEDEITFDQLQNLVGHEEAANFACSNSS